MTAPEIAPETPPPRPKAPKTSPFAFRLPTEMLERLKADASAAGKDVSEHCRNLLSAPKPPLGETATHPTSQIAVLQAQNTALLDWIASTVAIYGKVRGEARYTHVVVPALPPIPTA